VWQESHFKPLGAGNNIRSRISELACPSAPHDLVVLEGLGA
jgi:hypothetical protein